MDEISAALINDVARAICRQVIEMQHLAPEYLAEKYRFLPWRERAVFYIEKIAVFLSRSCKRRDLFNSVAKSMRKLFVPGFVYTKEHTKFSLALSLIINETPTHLLGTVPNGALLLDAENLHLGEAEEQQIVTNCNNPIAIKYAFGNWKNLGKRDAELSERNYELIHVPTGKNNADRSLSQFAIVLPTSYPFVKEVVVVSNDSDLDSLGNVLGREGIIAWRVKKKNSALLMTNCLTQETLLISDRDSKDTEACFSNNLSYFPMLFPPTPPSPPSPPNPPNPPTSPSSPSSPSSPTPSAVSPVPDTTVSVAEVSEGSLPKQINSRNELERSLSIICSQLTKGKSSVDMNSACTAFTKHYKQGLKQTLKQLGITPRKPSKFLQSWKSPKFRSNGKSIMVSQPITGAAAVASA
jgi:hypothetical protein